MIMHLLSQSLLMPACVHVCVITTAATAGLLYYELLKIHTKSPHIYST